jgi:phage/conjugal plasmid C-4 type zinc finger TraR family protein
MERFADELDLAQYQTDLLTMTAIAAVQQQMTAGGGREHCLDCGEPIPLARLQRVPSATRCTQCQEHHEARMRQHRGH